jgi:hypothetical protein
MLSYLKIYLPNNSWHLKYITVLYLSTRLLILELLILSEVENSRKYQNQKNHSLHCLIELELDADSWSELSQCGLVDWKGEKCHICFLVTAGAALHAGGRAHPLRLFVQKTQRQFGRNLKRVERLRDWLTISTRLHLSYYSLVGWWIRIS